MWVGFTCLLHVTFDFQSIPSFCIWSQDCYNRYSDIESEEQINECWIEDYKEIKDVIKNQDNG